MDITPILETLLRWRITLSLGGSIALALILSNLVDRFTAKYAIGLVIVGIALGTLWECRAMNGDKPIAISRLGRPVEFLTLSFFGVIAGGLVFGLSGSVVLATFALAASPTLAALWQALVEGRSKTSVGEIVFRTVCLLSGWMALVMSRALLG